MYGIIYYDYRTGRIADAGYDLGTFKNHVTINNATFDHDGNLCNDWVRSMAFDHTGHLWIGTSNGVSCLNTKTLSFKDFGWNNILKDRQANGTFAQSL
jgi:ligand-binding sensor domain-containing protein